MAKLFEVDDDGLDTSEEQPLALTARTTSINAEPHAGQVDLHHAARSDPRP